MQNVLESLDGGTPSVVSDADSDLVVCHEGEQLPLIKVAESLIDGRDDYARIASRLHTRIDVQWTSMPRTD